MSMEIDKGRKVIQLIEYNKVLLALCDDGSIWRKAQTMGDPPWARIPGPPRKG